ncbi:MAG TPA: ATP-binding cassette domain-containing protein [Limnochordia bacterium]
MPAIEVNGLVKTFVSKQKAPGLRGSLAALWRPRYRRVEAVRHISFTAEAGEMLAFIGPNGAGKSTTIKILTGILHPSAGDARVLGFVPWRQRTQLAFYIGSVFGQKSQLWYHLPPSDTFDLLAHIYELSPSVYRARRAALVDAFEIGDLMHTPVRRLSLGQRMRCEIAAALLHRPQVLFLDEPTIGLDVVAKQKIRTCIQRMNREEAITLFLTSHDTSDIEQLCRRVIVINHGTVILDAPISALKRDYIKEKVIDLRLAAPTSDLSIPGATVIKAKGPGVKLSVDTSQQSIQGVSEAIVRRYPVQDITILDPPLEEVIRAIYARKERTNP